MSSLNALWPQTIYGRSLTSTRNLIVLSNIRSAMYKLLPLSCPSCLQPEVTGMLCKICKSYLPIISEPCPICAMPNSQNLPCGQCQKAHPNWDEARIAWHFEDLTRFLIHQFKYQKDMSIGRALVNSWLAQTTQASRPEALLPMPMHYRKEHKRGYNQAAVLAKLMTLHLDIPIWPHAIRTRATEPLEGMNKRQRQQELKGCFQILKAPPKSIAIVDDVYTSGATTRELAKELKRNGTTHVSIWTLARTPLGGSIG